MTASTPSSTRGKVLMVQGTASSVGKSTLVAALCRIFRQDGLRVAPFKAQNMSNNSYVTRDGGEIGRAQAVQAEAAGIEAAVEMNPILLKPEADDRSQVVVLGMPFRSADARTYFDMKTHLWDVVTRSLDQLRDQYDIVVIEGAGSPAEINLKQDEIVNMRVARYAQSPVLLAGDIDRGGVFASLVGTLELLDSEERACIKAFIINKFRGDMAILEPGLSWLEERTGVPVAGVIPYFHEIYVAEEDTVALKPHGKPERPAPLDLAVVCLPHISNFDDFDALEREPEVGLRYVHTVEDLGTPDMVIVPGTKTTVADLEWLRTRGLADRIQSLSRDGAVVIGICGGYQILGTRILDPDGVESTLEEVEGLGLLPVTTVFEATKQTHRVTAQVRQARGILQEAVGLSIEGYEIHMGQSSYSEQAHPFLIQERSGKPAQQPDGAIDSSGRILGTYLHGLFDNTGFRRAVLRHLSARKGTPSSHGPEIRQGDGDLSRDAEYEKLAGLVRGNLDMELIYRTAALQMPVSQD